MRRSFCGIVVRLERLTNRKPAFFFDKKLWFRDNKFWLERGMLPFTPPRGTIESFSLRLLKLLIYEALIQYLCNHFVFWLGNIFVSTPINQNSERINNEFTWGKLFRDSRSLTISLRASKQSVMFLLGPLKTSNFWRPALGSSVTVIIGKAEALFRW